MAAAVITPSSLRRHWHSERRSNRSIPPIRPMTFTSTANMRAQIRIRISGRSCSAAIRAVSGRRGANRSDQSSAPKPRRRVCVPKKISFGILIMARPGDTCRRERTAAATPTV